MKYIPNVVSSRVGRQILHVQKASPTLLFVGGVVGVVATTILACRATLKLEEVLEDSHKNMELARNLNLEAYTEQDRKQDIAVIYIKSAVKVAKLYGPSVIVGTLSICALTGSHNILTRRNAALTAAYAAVEKGFADYRRRVVNEFGEDKDRELRYGSEKYEVESDKKGEKTKEVTRVGPAGASIYAKFFDEYSSSWSKTPEYNMIFLESQQTYSNNLLHSRGHVFLNEVYDMLGIERTQAGAVVGWVLHKDPKDGDNYVDFGIFDGNNPRARDFVNGREGSILLDFNVDGVIYDKI